MKVARNSIYWQIKALVLLPILSVERVSLARFGFIPDPPLAAVGP